MSKQPEIAPQTISELDHLADLSWQWFAANTHPASGLTLDRAANSERGEARTVSSLGGTGFYLALLPIAVMRDKISEQEGVVRALRTLKFVISSVENVNGILRHFVDWSTGKQVWNSEYSTLDTAMLLLG